MQILSLFHDGKESFDNILEPDRDHNQTTTVSCSNPNNSGNFMEMHS